MRDAVIREWLAKTDWAEWSRQEMIADASARRYTRLSKGGDTVILMDAPPNNTPSQAPFVAIAAHLRALGLAAPEVMAFDDGLGLMILEDLGQVDFAAHLRDHPKDELDLYEKATDVLMRIGSSAPPEGFTWMTPAVGADMIDLAFDYAALDQSPALRTDVKARIEQLLTDTNALPSVLSLRDYHAENLMWRAGRSGFTSVGLLDFQDAFVAHPAYDLSSLLHDARRDVGPDLLDTLITRMEPEIGNREAFKQAFHALSLQRNLRIMGIFNRLAEDAGKTGYLDLLPRVWAHIETDLAAPVCAPMAPLVRRAFDPAMSRP